MTFEPIGLATIAVGLICLMLRYQAATIALIIATLFGAAAAIFVGGANIQPAHLLLAFAAIAILTRHREAAAAIRSISPSEPGFWLLCFVVYGVFSAYLMPRILAGGTEIIPLGISEYAETGSTVPLGPVSSNVTQSIYMSANLACFCLIVAVASTRDGFKAVATGLILFCAGNMFFALVDLATYATGTQGILEFMRNAQYTLHHEEEVNGLKRIVGSFTEASSFARSTLGALGFTGTLWLFGYWPAWTGPLALASLILVVLSTSSAGLAGVVPVLMILYATALLRCGIRTSVRRSSAVVLIAPPLLLAVTLLVLLDAETSANVRGYLDTVVLNKAGTDSAVERASWNDSALKNVIDTWGVGTGLGTVRTSSFAFALLANVGILGTLFYALFTATAFLRRRGNPGTFPSDVRIAACNAFLGLLIGDLMVAPSVDQGLLYFVFVGLAASEPERGMRRMLDVSDLRPARMPA